VNATAPFIAMERLRGHSLSELLATRGRLAPTEISQLLHEVGCGLDAAHAIGVVHRDIKPTNLFHADVDGRRLWKVLDFGIAKLSATRSTLTQGMIVGTPAYMAPEQAGGKVTALSDIFALGVLTYRALTGCSAFGGVAWADTIYRTATCMPPRPSTTDGVGEALDAVMAIALAKDPADRFESARALAKAFEAAITGVLDDDLEERAWSVLRKHPWGCDAASLAPSNAR
jgi:serine/threonine-protein kinase